MRHSAGAPVKVAFSGDNASVYSTGAVDGAVFIWNVLSAGNEAAGEPAAEVEA